MLASLELCAALVVVGDSVVVVLAVVFVDVLVDVFVDVLADALVEVFEGVLALASLAGPVVVPGLVLFDELVAEETALPPLPPPQVLEPAHILFRARSGKLTGPELVAGSSFVATSSNGRANCPRPRPRPRGPFS